MKLPDIKEVKSKDQARQLAIDWQDWQSERSMDYWDFLETLTFFVELADRFHLKREFKENCII